jgi:hypothetical protein
LLAVHRVYQGLVAITQVGRQPTRRLLDGLAGPLAIWDVERLEGLVFCGGIREPESCVSKYCMSLCWDMNSQNLHGHDCDVGALASWVGEVSWV